MNSHPHPNEARKVLAVPSEKLNLEYAPETLRVSQTSYPNGVTVKYNGQGRKRYNLLSSNDPLVLAEAELRKPIRNTFKRKQSIIEQAGVIINMTSKKLKQAKG